MMIHWKKYDISKLDVSDTISKRVYNSKKVYDEKGKREKVQFSNIIFSFDIETTSFFETPDGEIIMFDNAKPPEYYEKCKKYGVPYLWMVGINDEVVYGRDLNEYAEFEIQMHKHFGEVRRIYYVHNLSFDFHWIQSVLGTSFDVFSRKKRKIMKAEQISPLEIEYRCSYILTNRTLENAAKDYKLPVEKKVGQLDYNVMRTPLTVLTEEELEYGEYDCLVIYHLIKKHIEEYGNIYDIPLTSTGKVRKVLKDIYVRDRFYKEKVSKLTPSWDEFKLLCEVYSGGYTHANWKHADKILKNVYAYDIASSYPYEIVSKKYPMSKFSEISVAEYKHLSKENFAFIFDITLYDIEAKYGFSYISLSKLIVEEDLVDKIEEDNGRVVKAKRVRVKITEQDLEIILKAYDIDKISINKVWCAKKDYLDHNFIELVLDLYKGKTELKGIEEEYSKYMTSKEYLNALYGMMVMKILTDEILYEHGKWNVEELNSEKANEILDKKYADKKEVLTFSWGVWVAAYARRHLWEMILKDPDNIAYVDTDSIYALKDFSEYIEEDKLKIFEEAKQVWTETDVHMGRFFPTDSKGVNRPIGFWEIDGFYDEFKTLGAKRYATKKDGEIKLTVSGVNKKNGSKAIKSLEEFKEGLVFDYETAGKKIVHYVDNQPMIELPDGFVSTYKYTICLQPTTYNLSLKEEYFDLINDNGLIETAEILRGK